MSYNTASATSPTVVPNAIVHPLEPTTGLDALDVLDDELDALEVDADALVLVDPDPDADAEPDAEPVSVGVTVASCIEEIVSPVVMHALVYSGYSQAEGASE